MPELKLVLLEDILSRAEQRKLLHALEEFGVDELPEGDDQADMEEALTEDQLTDFMDRLEAQDVACDIYLPVEFEGTFEVGGRTVGSSFQLIDALEELREELDIDGEEGEDEEEDLDLEVIEEQIRYAWRIFLRGASTSIDRLIPLVVVE